ncbi:hypothetical protein F5Y10DRAFT_265670 [Nemania abortiva]|nr:hypothetical protein F5Y10DRAFT_265670 [Nemania abortiva]
MEPQPFDKFTYAGKPLEKAPKTMAECQTPENWTAYLVENLRVHKHTRVREFLEETQTVLRLFKPKEIVTKHAARRTARFDFGGRHVKAIAYYLFQGYEAPVPCKQCTDSRSGGPGERCIVISVDRTRGCCTNCYYSGKGHCCSIRVSKMERQREQKHQRKEERQQEDERQREAEPSGFNGFTEEMLNAATTEQLSDWYLTLKRALRNRNRAKIGDVDHAEVSPSPGPSSL